MMKESRSINPSRFLSETHPVSRVFGLDRGKAIDRYYIDKFLSHNCQICQESSISSVLEVGDDAYSRLFFPIDGNNSIRYDVLRFDKGQDLTDVSTIPCGAYDVFICTQVLNFIYDVRRAIEGARYLLTSGGTLLATVAGNISQVSRYDMDRWGHFWGFTYEGIRRLMVESFGEDNVRVFPYGNALAATAFIQGLAQEDLPDLQLLDDNDNDYAIVIGVVAKKT